MPQSDRNDPDEVRERSRSRKDDPNQGIGGEEAGVRLPVPTYTEDDQASFLGVDEPVVPPGDHGEPPPEVPLPTRRDRERS
jgi:hypothetical protein